MSDKDIVDIENKRYTLYMNDEVVSSSDNLEILVDTYENLYAQGQEGFIMDNLIDLAVYGR